MRNSRESKLTVLSKQGVWTDDGLPGFKCIIIFLLYCNACPVLGRRRVEGKLAFGAVFKNSFVHGYGVIIG